MSAALDELTWVHRWASAELAASAQKPRREVQAAADHLLLHARGEALPASQALLASHVRRDFEELPNLKLPHKRDRAARRRLLGELLERLSDFGPALLVELTPAELAAFGLRVVRAIVPGHVPLFAGEQHRPRAALCARAQPSAAGSVPDFVTFDARFDPVPHPFAAF